MIDEVRFDADVPRQHVRDEPIRECRLVAQESKHRALLDDEDGVGVVAVAVPIRTD